MPRMTLSIPDEVKKRMDALPNVNWPELIRAGLKAKVEKLKRFEREVGW